MDYLATAPFTGCTTKAGASAGTTTTLTTANLLQYAIRGKAYSKAAASNEATPTLDSNTGVAFAAIPANNGAAVILCRDASGNLKAAQGAQQPLDVNGNFINAPQLPALPDATAPFAYLIVKAGATASPWTFGASNLAGPPTGVVFAFQDLQTFPDRPQVS